MTVISELHIKYYDRYKYQLAEEVSLQIPIYGETVDKDFYSLDRNGTLTIFKGYAWDGSTGAPDLPESLPASLVHDVLCQMINYGQIKRKWQLAADLIYRDICQRNGLPKWRACLRYRALRTYDDSGMKKYQPKPVLTAP